jgi:hypothetical protein
MFLIISSLFFIFVIDSILPTCWSHSQILTEDLTQPEVHGWVQNQLKNHPRLIH